MSQPEQATTIMNHVSVGSNDMQRACDFYDKVLAVIGATRVLDLFPEAVAYGRGFPEFWVTMPHDKKPAAPGNGTHFAFMAESREQVQRFHQIALEAGAASEGEPGARPEYSDAYYGCFLRDHDGHKIEAIFWNPTEE